MKVKVKVDRLVCISLASCTIMAPSVFKLDDMGKAIIDEDLPNIESQVHLVNKSEEKDESGNTDYVWEIDADEDWIQKNIIPGAQSCPVTAIKVWNSETNEVMYPSN